MIGIKLDLLVLIRSPISITLGHFSLPQVTVRTTVRYVMIGLKSATGVKMLID